MATPFEIHTPPVEDLLQVFHRHTNFENSKTVFHNSKTVFLTEKLYFQKISSPTSISS